MEVEREYRIDPQGTEMQCSSFTQAESLCLEGLHRIRSPANSRFHKYMYRILYRKPMVSVVLE
jgi:hypothetical protein